MPKIEDDWPIARSGLIFIAGIILVPIMFIWPFLGMASDLYFGGTLSRSAFYVMVLSPILLVAIMVAAVLSKRWHSKRLLVGAWTLCLLIATVWTAVFVV